jgi:hypothetical protein
MERMFHQGQSTFYKKRDILKSYFVALFAQDACLPWKGLIAYYDKTEMAMDKACVKKISRQQNQSSTSMDTRR